MSRRSYRKLPATSTPLPLLSNVRSLLAAAKLSERPQNPLAHRALRAFPLSFGENLAAVQMTRVVRHQRRWKIIRVGGPEALAGRGGQFPADRAEHAVHRL